MRSMIQHFALAALAVVGSLFATANLQAEAPQDAICVQAAEIVCLSADMKDQIKCHFRGVKGYGRLLAANAVVKAKAAAIKRRVNRNACYKRLAKDADCLENQVCKLESLYGEVLACSSCQRPIHGEPCCAAALLAEMRRLSQCVKAEACVRLGLAPPVVVVPATTYELAPVSEPLEFQPIQEPVPYNDTPYNVPRIESNYPPATPPSVLELQTDPILELPDGY